MAVLSVLIGSVLVSAAIAAISIPAELGARKTAEAEWVQRKRRFVASVFDSDVWSSKLTSMGIDKAWEMIVSAFIAAAGIFLFLVMLYLLLL